MELSGDKVGRSMGPIDHPCMAIIALGTLGDVLPLLTLSCELMVTSKESVRIIFVTNAAHKNTVDSYIKPLPESTVTRNHFRAEYVQCSPLSVSLESMRSDFYDMDSVDEVCRKVALMSDLILVIANLFCLAGSLVAELRRVRCILIHPHKPPSKMPPNFKSMLKRRLPNFYRQLFAEPTTCRERDEGNLVCKRNKECEDDDIDQKLPVILDSCSWQDYEEWLWPTLTSMYDSTRRVLKLRNVSSPSYIIPRRPIVLLVQSPQFYPPPGYWPSDRYIVCGCITHDQLTCRSLPATATAQTPCQKFFPATLSLLPSFSPLIDEFISRQDCNTVCVDFGSMTELLVSQYEWGTFCSTLLALANSNFSFIMNCQSFFNVIMESFIAASQCRGNGCPSSPSSPSLAPGAATYSTQTTESNRTIEIEGVLLLEGHVEHTLLFRKCVAVVHHGGAGTLSTCLRSGVPQVVMPIIHDQYDNADRLQYMHMTPDSVPIAKIFPKRKRLQKEPTGLPGETINVEESASATKRARVSLVGVEFEVEVEVEVKVEVEPMTAEAEGIAAAVALMRQRLQWSCTPAHRLRCGCFGRDMRSQQSERGLENVLGVVMKQVALEMEGREKKDVAVKEKCREMEGAKESAFLINDGFLEQSITNDNGSSSSGSSSSGSSGHGSMKSGSEGDKGCHNSAERAETAPGSDGVEWQELGDSVIFATHHVTAPEETAFLFNEVFLQRAYMRHGIRLAENDLVIDVGANIGFFAVFVELEFDVPDALRIIAIEPCPKNFKLLQQNMKLYAPTAHLVQAAISSVPRKSKRTLNGADGNVGKHRKRVSRSDWAPNQHEVGGNLRSSMRDREDRDEGLTGDEGGITMEGAENKRMIFVKDEESEVVDDEISEGKEEEGEGEGEEHAFMTYYPRMPGNSRMTHCAGEGPSYSHSSFQTGSCQERVVVKSLSDVIDDYERQNKYTDHSEDSDGSGDHCDDTGASVLYSGETRGGDTRENIALLKVDVEGSELCVLQSLELRHWNRIDQIVVETERPNEGAEGSVSAEDGSAGDVINCNTHYTREKQSCGADDGELHQPSNYYRIHNLLKLHGFRVVEEWGDPDGYDTGCLLLFGIKKRY